MPWQVELSSFAHIPNKETRILACKWAKTLFHIKHRLLWVLTILTLSAGVHAAQTRPVIHYHQAPPTTGAQGSCPHSLQPGYTTVSNPSPFLSLDIGQLHSWYGYKETHKWPGGLHRGKKESFLFTSGWSSDTHHHHQMQQVPSALLSMVGDRIGLQVSSLSLSQVSNSTILGISTQKQVSLVFSGTYSQESLYRIAAQVSKQGHSGTKLSSSLEKEEEDCRGKAFGGRQCHLPAIPLCSLHHIAFINK